MKPDKEEKVDETHLSNIEVAKTSESAGESSTSTALDVRREGSSEAEETDAKLLLLRLIQTLRSRVEAWVIVELSFIPLHVEFKVFHEDLKRVSHAIADYQEAGSAVSTTHLGGEWNTYDISRDSPTLLQI